MKLVRQEFIGVLCLDSPLFERLGREVPEIGRDDEIGTAFDCCREHMAVIGVGQFQHINELFEIRDQGVASMQIHQVARPLELRTGQVRSVSKNGPDPFLVYRIRPFRAVEIRDRELQKEIAERCWIEDGRVEEGSKIAQGSVSHFQVLSLRGKLIEHFAPICVDVLLVSQNILKPEAPVSADETEGEFLLFKQLHEEWPRDI